MLDTALSAMGSGELVFGHQKEIVLSVNALPALEIRRFVTRQKKLFPRVKARGVMVSVRVDKSREETGLLDWLCQI